MIFCRRQVFIKLSVLLAMIAIAISVSIARDYSRQEVIDKSEACLDCHDGKSQSLAESPHRISVKSESPSAISIGCINCHDGWEAHLEDPSEETITHISELASTRLAEICSGCHSTQHQLAMISTDPHSKTEMSCVSCHTIHNNGNETLLKTHREDFCVSCHSSVASEFMRRSAHPLESENINCLDCHNMKDAGLYGISNRTVGLDWTCQECHIDLAGPFIHEHPVVYNHYVEGGGCTECHQPHGSNNDRLLNQPGNGLCFQCHSTPPGHFTNHSGLGSKLVCVECHRDIHGSYDNKLMLDPDLGSKLFPDCYQSGCHNPN